ncbi:MAG: glycerophosphodiester phosphodiesterase family protein [Clostridia bacterium]|nr:glycerophosphodiester phosphodiesterase family protein [Clostridia bacterium]MBR2296890.1 glycerophosphodiester phosphodiesterase family protein [Clostridia bacterium]
MDFTKSIFENRKEKGSPFLVAHRGVCGANVPCNTIASYKIALSQGADVVEIDVARSSDGVHYVFHPGMEHVFLGSSRQISEMTSSEVDEMFLLNQDHVKTSYKVPYLKDVLTLLKGKAYINVDKFWTDVEGISRVIRECGVEDQVIIKTYPNPSVMADIEKYASDFMFMTMAWGKDDTSEGLLERNINVIGAEVLFSRDSDECISEEYIAKMHNLGLLVWVNSIIYNEADVISAHHTDDISLYDDPEKGWGWILDKNVDFIQTDWLLMLKDYIAKRG